MGKGYAGIGWSTSLSVIDRHYEEGLTPLRIIGSSLGGYLAARYASLHPGKVDRVALLNPAFNLPSLFAERFGSDEMDAWKNTGFKDFAGLWVHRAVSASIQYAENKVFAHAPPIPAIHRTVLYCENTFTAYSRT